MRLIRSFIAVSLVASFASPPSPARAQGSDAIAKLEAQRAKNPDNANTLRQLGVAYFKAKRYSDAQTALARAAQLNPKDGVTALYLGMSAEEQGDLIAARAAYTTYLARGKTKSAKDEVNKKLAALSYRELQARAKAAVVAEQQLSAQPGPANSLAVLPLSVSSADTNYRALGRGLADLMISDFGKVAALKLLERDRMQAILDEIRLGQTAAIDPNTAVRGGKLIQAERIVTGTLTIASAQNVQMNGGAITVATSAALPAQAQSGPLEQIFNLEKNFVLGVLRTMNVALTTAEMQAIQGNRPTSNVQAFLAFSRGLAASDAGRLDEAARFFDNARALDPNFTAAATQAANARAGTAGQSVTTAQIDSRVRGGSEGQTVAAAERGAVASASDALGSTLDNALADVNPSTADAVGRVSTTASSRDASSSTTSQDQPTGRTGTVTIVIKRP